MIQLSGVGKWYPTRFGRKWVFRDLTLAIPQGSRVALLGRNGAGKSTLLRMIAGHEHISEGSIRVDGSISWSLALTGGSIGSMTGRENARFVARLHGCSRQEVERVADFALAYSELGRDFDLPIGTYSSGMRSRLGFAIGMAFRFDWYIGDEFSAVGDPAFRAKSEAAMKALKGSSSWILATHQVGNLEDMVDLVILLDGGRAHVHQDVSAGLAAYRALL